MTFAGHIIIKTDGTYQDIPLLAYQGHIPRQSSVLTLPKEISCINILVAGLQPSLGLTSSFERQ